MTKWKKVGIVGVYISPKKTNFDIEPDGTILLAEMSPAKV
jgi:hypothetical protein